MPRNLKFIILSLLISSKLFSQTDIVPDTSIRIFEKVDIEASYPGGETAWRKFLEKNLNPSAPVDNGAPNGQYTVYLQFIVNTDGRISDIKPLTKQGYGMEQEVVRIMNKSGLWSPALMNNEPVKAYRKQPVTFLVMTDGFDINSKTPYVLFTNTDNELTIEVDNVKAENLEAIISQGTITDNGDGKFIARVTKPGRVLITVYNKKKMKKELGVMSFEVRSPGTTPAGAGK